MASNRGKTPPDPRVAKRLRAILEYHDISPSDLAKRIKVDKASVSQWLNLKNAMSGPSAKAIADALGEDIDFVLCRTDTGKGGYGAALDTLQGVVGTKALRDMAAMDEGGMQQIAKFVAVVTQGMSFLEEHNPGEAKEVLAFLENFGEHDDDASPPRKQPTAERESPADKAIRLAETLKVMILALEKSVASNKVK